MALSSLASVPITSLKGIGPKVAERLAKIGINNIEDALFHLPARYEDRSRIVAIADTLVGSHVAVVGQVQSANIQFGKRRTLVVSIADASGGITLRFFNFSAAQKNQFAIGKWLKCFGEIRGGRVGPEIIHPEYKALSSPDEVVVNDSLTPVYPTTEGVKQATLRNVTDQALSRLEKYQVRELLPENLLPQKLSLKDALILCHRPPLDASYEELEFGTHPAQQRLALEELVSHQLSMKQLKSKAQQVSAKTFGEDTELTPKFLASLPFSPTGAQLRVVSDIKIDLARPAPMMRLVQGDVGSGKTLVAALAALGVIAKGDQVALMAPTEILAEQHAINFKQWLEPLGITVSWLAGKTKASERKVLLEQIGNGQSQMIVGTHAIFQDAVEFSNLSLVIIDEQHRFGVHQRLALRNKGSHVENGVTYYPHQLVMTATPIPRTLAMTAYADLDCSIIDELPPGRTPVTTVAIPDTRRQQVIDRVRDVCNNTGQQAYWVCTLVEESEVLQCQAAEDTCEELQKLLPELNVGLVHGRMKPAEKQQVMEDFKSAKLNLLVATTVIEVGVDVPNSSLMIIENPERLGLAQLHQLRGRVGRGALQSHCVLLYHAPLSHTAQQRLGVLRDSTDGFVIAQKDLEIRGAGEILGTRQTGVADFKIADLERDKDLVKVAFHIAEQLLKQTPEQQQELIQRWLGDKQIYGNA